MFKYLFFLILIQLIFACQQNSKVIQNKENKKTKVEKTSQSEYTVIPVEYPGTGWGYQILQDGKLAIDQKHIPVIQGYRGFSSKEKAEKTGNFIVEKMKSGIFPPTLTEEELDSLEVL